MLITTLLNQVEKFKSFVYKKVHLEQVQGEEALVMDIVPRKHSKPVCRICMRACGTLRWKGRRLFESVPRWTWKWKVYFDMRRVGRLVRLMGR